MHKVYSFSTRLYHSTLRKKKEIKLPKHRKKHISKYSSMMERHNISLVKDTEGSDQPCAEP